MQSRKAEPRETWLQCRQSFEQWVKHDPLFAVPLEVIDWAFAHDLTDNFYASMSLHHLVISNKQWQATRADKVVIIPKPDAVEIRIAHSGEFARAIEIDRAVLSEELGRVFSEFQQGSRKSPKQ